MKNYAASVRAKLTEVANRQNIRFQQIVMRFLHERLLYRLAQSRFSENFCLKGGTLFYAIEGLTARPTRDLDLLGRRISNTPEHLGIIFKEICEIVCEADGVVFEKDEIEVSEIVKEGNYRGTRILLSVQLGQIREKIQVDIGFGDKIVPKPVLMVFPAILDLPAPELLCYSIESVIAEKFHAMIALSEINSRMKDFYDLSRLLQPGRYNHDTLKSAVKETFQTRQTKFPAVHPLFTPDFGEHAPRQQQWNVFLRKSKLNEIDFREVHRQIREVMEPLCRALLLEEGI